MDKSVSENGVKQTLKECGYHGGSANIHAKIISGNLSRGNNALGEAGRRLPEGIASCVADAYGIGEGASPTFLLSLRRIWNMASSAAADLIPAIESKPTNGHCTRLKEEVSKNDSIKSGQTRPAIDCGIIGM